MNEVKFSGRAAFSYIWSENEKKSTFRRLCSAIGAGIVGCIFGYRVNVAEVEGLLIKTEHGTAYFKK